VGNSEREGRLETSATAEEPPLYAIAHRKAASIGRRGGAYRAGRRNPPSSYKVGQVRIGELARLGDVSPKTIRYYESIGLLSEPARTPSGYRDYDGSYADRLTFIRTAKRLGITLDEVKEILSFPERGKAPCSYVRGVLEAQVDSIDRRIRELESLRSQLIEIVAEADRLPEVGGTCRLIEHVRQKTAATTERPGES
jgi:DNA-binding transcriptional MerR regulator